MNKEEAHHLASRFYLTEGLPVDLFGLDEQEVYDFIEDHKWEPLEQWEPHGIWELIEDLAEEYLSIDAKARSDSSCKGILDNSHKLT